MSLRFLLLLITVIFSWGCASIDSQPLSQKVYVKTDPHGAKIFLNGEYIGVTPTRLVFPRTRKDQVLEFRSGGQTLYHELESQYRWVDSFLANLLLLSGAPVGWGVDLLTGSAWQYDEQVFARFKDRQQELWDRIIAIAPPQGQHEWLSAEIATQVENYIQKKYPKSRVLPYEITQDIFQAHEFNYHNRPPLSEQGLLMKELKEALLVTHVVESFYEYNNQNVQIYTEFNRTTDLSIEQEHNFEFPSVQISKVRKSMWRNKVGNLFVVVPNNIALVGSSSETSITIGSQNFNASNKASGGFLGEVSKVLSTLSIHYLEGPTRRDYWRYKFQFVPTFIFNWSDFQFEESSLLKDVRFTKLAVGGGYGPQWSFYSKWGRLFIEVSPILSYLDLSWESPQGGSGETWTGFTMQTRLGYTFFVNKRFNVTLFTSTVDENRRLWQTTVDRITSTTGVHPVDYSSNIFGGIAFGYYFSADENPLRYAFD